MTKQEVGLDHRFDNTGDKKTLKDIQIIDGKVLDDKMAHVEIVNNNLVLTIDFEHNNRFAISEYLALAGFGIEEVVRDNLIDPIDK